MHYPDDDSRDITDVPPSEPLGSVPVTFDIPMPRIEQVTAEIARQLVGSYFGYDHRAKVQSRVEDAIAEAVNAAIASRIVPLIETLLDRPMQPTDTFGNPVGEPTSLQAFVAQRVSGWADDMVDRDGKCGKPDPYNRDKYQPRLHHVVATVVNRELSNAVAAETNRIVQELKKRGTQKIASEISERLSSLIIKS